MSTPDYGRRLIVPLVEHKAATNPSGVYCTLPTSATNLASHALNITWRDLARLVDQAAWWLEAQLGKPKAGTFPTIAFIGLNSPLYHVLALASAKTGYKILFNSPRNSVKAQLYLFDKTECKVLLRGPRAGSMVQDILEARPKMRCVTVPEPGDWMREKGQVKRYPYDKSWEQGKDDPVIVLHSSGSTGPPKPIPIMNASMGTIDAHHLIKDVAGKRDVLRTMEGTTMFNPMPNFHAAGVFWNFMSAIYFDIHVVYAPVGQPLKAELVEKALDQMKFDWMFLPPSIIEDLARDEHVLPKLEKMRYIGFGGGPLSQQLGDVIAKHTQVINVLGTTENAVPPYNFVPLKEWNWILVPPEMKGVEMRPREEDEFSEMVIVRDEHTNPFHSTWSTFPNEAEYHTKDLFVRHPTEPHLWQHRARSDDVLVLSNGEKVVPIPMEGQLSQSPHISGVVVLGHGRFETAVLIELSPQAQRKHSPAENLAAIALFIDKANAAAPAFARISRDRVLFTSPDKPMTRAGKGTVIRKATLKQYEKEIEDLYAGRSSIALSSTLPLHVDTENTSDTEAALTDLFGKLAGAKKKLGLDDDFFAAGIDSLQVLTVVRQLKAQLTNEHAPLSPNLVSLSMVYANPTIRKLARTLHAAAAGGGGGKDGNAGARNADQRAKEMKEMYLRYAHDLPHRTDATTAAASAAAASSKEEPVTVVLTGSTGSLGSYILASLLSHPPQRIAHVYCLNRGSPSSTAKKQRQRFEDSGLPTAGLDQGNRVTFLETDPGADLHGLSDAAYAELVQRTRYIIHNAWAVDFNMALDSFAPHVKGVRNMIDLAYSAGQQQQLKSPPPIFFTSTINTVRNYNVAAGPGEVPEAPIHDVQAPGEGGYGEGKYVGERLLEAAGTVSGVPAAICRTGQIGGPVASEAARAGKGKWNVQEWFPTIVRSSKHLGALPTSIAGMDQADWVPVDLAADVVVDVMFDNLRQLRESKTAGRPLVQFDHLVNPKTSSYPKVILPALQKRLAEGGKGQFPAVPYEEWLRRLQDEAAKPDADPVKCPGIKLLDWFEGLGEGLKALERGEPAGFRLQTKETVKRSETLRNLEPVNAEWVNTWCQGWGM
ncbi:Non-canonical non-ribosomal peptide synthetase FUB8 [Lasiodiplodia theobromae]|uniref:Non-canonical non-ribosomal peptide synthetase FUB8 n=1 Tax=Lasiodiplodia theobromae TaxID=45133 RepID=A0A5N5D0M0_9PEZI|nr:Non-canonical non-ribosomal peptide synthetase FUB8 [Lasiodiplodia theobromae]